ncbi:beta-1,3-galactosyltransferase 1-like [Stylophora pistillata]|uniref:beta-1,3-galactosyltransferase 1-like n=1 Tax=Stylophora pistillata TaxID=50429 RepID=UPI000C042865|nr:beta-1,3-galactosyltransferase 1-like [Stylophora pistillata]XP_022805077.1 beta-1,3-galactosyltransferase 1-like [Stylophora pistillata]
MKRAFCKIVTVVGVLCVAVVVIYLKLYHPHDTHKRTFTNKEELESQRRVHSSSINDISNDILTKYSRLKNIRSQCSQLTFSFASHVTQPTLSSSNKSIFLLILITSGVGKLYSERRNSVRKTWGDKSIKSGWRNWELAFVIGKALGAQQSEEISQEAAVFKDILVLNMTDSYNNLVIKIFSELLWSLIYVNPRFILKADDDVYVRIPRLLSWLDNYANDNYANDNYAGDKLYGGFVIGDADVKREEKWKNRVAKDCLARDFYAPYCSGPFYVLSTDVLPSIFEAVERKPAFPVEDAYMGILAQEIGLQPVDIPGFYFRKKLADYRRCEFASAIAIGHNFGLMEFISVAKNMEQTKQLPRSYYKCILVYEWLGFVFLLMSPIILLFLVFIFVKFLSRLKRNLFYVYRKV